MRQGILVSPFCYNISCISYGVFLPAEQSYPSCRSGIIFFHPQRHFNKNKHIFVHNFLNLETYFRFFSELGNNFAARNNNKNKQLKLMYMKGRITILTLVMAMFIMVSCDNNDSFDNGKLNVNQVPEAVMAEFEEKFPDASNVSWAKKYDSYAVASFTNTTGSGAGNDHTAWFDWGTGKWNMTEVEMPYSMIPEAVKTAFEASDYSKSPWVKDNEVDFLQRPDNAEALYVIKVEKKESGVETEMELYYTAAGVLVKEIADVEKDYDYHDYLPQTPSNDISTWLNTNYPGARMVDMEREHNSTEIEFVSNGLKYEAVFDASNQWVYTKTDYGRNYASYVPELVMSALTGKYSASEWRVDDAEKFESATNSYFSFELQRIRSAWDDEIDVYIGTDGTFIDRPQNPDITVGGAGSVPVADDLMTFIEQKYSGAVVIGKEYDDGLLEIKISHNGLIKEVKFNGRNQWVKTEYDLYNYEDLPLAVRTTLEADKDFQKVRMEMEVTETPSDTIYKIEIETARAEVQYTINAAGTLLHKEYDD